MIMLRMSLRRQQHGAVLIIGLILLVVLAMIGMTGMQTTTQQERMAGNLRDRNAAFQSAETALRAGENEVDTTIVTPMGSGYYDSSEGQPPPADSNLGKETFWTAASSVTISAVSGTAAAPAYMIERRVSSDNLSGGEAKTKEIFLVTARGVGTSMNSAVVLQSTFRR